MAEHAIASKLVNSALGSGKERRTAKRYASDQVASCRAMPGVDAIPVQVRDVSVGGVGLLSPKRFERGTMLIVELHSTGPESVSVFAKVVRLTSYGSGQWLIGCAFFDTMHGVELEAFRTSPTNAAERQASVRVSDKTIAVCRRASVGALGEWAAEVQDHSAAGMGLLLSFPLEVDALLKVTLPTEGKQQASTVFVRVVSRERQADGKWRHACEITQPPAKGTPVATSGTGAVQKR